MTLKKTANNKRTQLPRTTDYTKAFLKDWERLSHSGRYDMNKLKAVMMLLAANDAPLPAECVMVKYFRRDFKLLSLKIPCVPQVFDN